MSRLRYACPSLSIAPDGQHSKYLPQHMVSMVKPDVYECCYCHEVFDLAQKRTEPSKAGGIPMIGPSLENAPRLKIDTILYPKSNGVPHTRGVLERRIVWNLLKHLKQQGFKPWAVAGGDDGNEDTPDALAAMELLFNLDEACLGFVIEIAERHEDHEVGNVVFTFGEGLEIISDWRWSNGTPAGRKFNKAMEAFNAEDYA